MNFFDQNIYYFSFTIIIFLFIVFSFTKVNQAIVKNQKIIAYTFAFLQFIAFFASVINNLFIELAWEKAMLQDLCPAVQFVSIIVFIYQKERGYKMIMPWLIIGSTVTMLGGQVAIFSNPIKIISYMRHTLMLIQGFLAYLWVGKYSFSQKWEILIFPSLLIVYIFITGFIPWQVTGDNRWVIFSTALFQPAIGVGTQYEILSSIGIPYPLSTILFYILAVFGSETLAFSKEFMPVLKLKTKDSWHKIKKITTHH